MFRGRNGGTYNQGSFGTPANSGQGVGFPNQRPRFQSSPRGNHQYVPYHCGPGGRGSPSPHRAGFPSPRGGSTGSSSPFGSSSSGSGSPYYSDRGMQTPPHYQLDQGYISPRGSSTPYHTPFQNNRNRRGRGGYQGNDSFRSESNPGGSDDMNLYYKPSFTQDPWAGLTPVAVQSVSSAT